MFGRSDHALMDGGVEQLSGSSDPHWNTRLNCCYNGLPHAHLKRFVQRCARYYLEDTIFILKIEDTILSCIFKILFKTILS